MIFLLFQIAPQHFLLFPKYGWVKCSNRSCRESREWIDLRQKQSVSFVISHLTWFYLNWVFVLRFPHCPVVCAYQSTKIFTMITGITSNFVLKRHKDVFFYNKRKSHYSCSVCEQSIFREHSFNVCCILYPCILCSTCIQVLIDK